MLQFFVALVTIWVGTLVLQKHGQCEEVEAYWRARKREGCDRLTALPDGILVLTVLKTLDLSGCARLRGLPEGVSALTTLQMLGSEKVLRVERAARRGSRRCRRCGCWI